MDKRNLAINNQIEQFIKIIVESGLYYERKHLNDISDQQQVFKIISEENKYLKTIVTKINKIKELTSELDTHDMNIDNLDSVIELLNSKNAASKVIELALSYEFLKISEKEESEFIEEPKIIIKTICNLDEIKRAFFSNECDNAFELLKKYKLAYYRVSYKYASDNDNKPDFIAKNLVGGFVRNLEDFSKYFLVCFRCYKKENTFDYPSLWIVNIDTGNTIQDVIGKLYDDFEFVNDENIDTFLNELQKKSDTDENLLVEKYLH